MKKAETIQTRLLRYRDRGLLTEYYSATTSGLSTSSIYAIGALSPAR